MPLDPIPVCLTVDAEPDCPPYLDGWRGMEEGLPRLLRLLDATGVRATVFMTGAAAECFPDAVRAVVRAGHELGCHGWSHRPFPGMDAAEAGSEIARSAALLRRYAPVTSFRAPYLRLPDRHLPLLARAGFRVDSSQGRHKPEHWPALAGSAWRRLARGGSGRWNGGMPVQGGIRRLPASTTSSVLRLPAPLRDPLLRALRPPVVLFVHPWEFVDLRREPIRWDCRLGTGPHALRSLRQVIALFRRRGAVFRTVAEVTESAVADGEGPADVARGAS